MLDLVEIQNTIEELENGDTTFANCEKLASLYIVLDKLQVPQDSIEDEINDILPAYKNFKDIKRKYQLKELPDIKVINELQILCKQIQEFIDILYVSTDMPQERHIIIETLTNLHDKYVGNP